MTMNSQETESVSTKATKDFFVSSTKDSVVIENKFKNYISSSADSASVSFERSHSNWHRHLYGELASAIEKMSKLSDNDEYHIQTEAAQKALTVLAFIRENVAVEPPKILNQSGEAISFTWNLGNIKRYLTVADDEIDLMLLQKPNGVRCEETLSVGEDIDWAKILNRLGGAVKSASWSEK
jgi:hypothetical protein